MTGPVIIDGDEYFSEYKQTANGGIMSKFENCIHAELSDQLTKTGVGKNVKYGQYVWRLSEYSKDGKTYLNVFRSTIEEHERWLASRGWGGNKQTIQSLTPPPRQMPPAPLTRPMSPQQTGKFRDMDCLYVNEEGGMDSVRNHLNDGFVFVNSHTIGDKIVIIMGLP